MASTLGLLLVRHVFRLVEPGPTQTKDVEIGHSAPPLLCTVRFACPATPRLTPQTLPSLARLLSRERWSAFFGHTGDGIARHREFVGCRWTYAHKPRVYSGLVDLDRDPSSQAAGVLTCNCLTIEMAGLKANAVSLAAKGSPATSPCVRRRTHPNSLSAEVGSNVRHAEW